MESQLAKNHLWLEQEEEEEGEVGVGVGVGVGLLARRSRQPTNGVGTTSTSSDQLVEIQGNESINRISETQSEIQKNYLNKKIHHQPVKNVEDQNSFGWITAPVEQLHKETNTSFKHFDNATNVDVDVDLIEEIKDDLMELDVERVLEEQNTHDLYCPNCNSCINRRVILRKRPKVSITRYKLRRVKKPEANSVYEDSRILSIYAADAAPCGKEPFGCLSCFSFFIPIAREGDILKSIVYGGLIESITSFGVVSSAAGAGADTLTVLALGLANVIGGLLVISHNLRELKNDQLCGVSTEINVEEDRYQVLLGQRQNFVLHVTVAILSFLVFGLVPPFVYGFSFRKSDDKDLKLIAVAGSSLVCIVLLALGKGHVRKPHRYFRTLSYYLVIGIMASGISYVVGELMKKLLENLGLFEASSAISVPFLETIPLEMGRPSY